MPRDTSLSVEGNSSARRIYATESHRRVKIKRIQKSIGAFPVDRCSFAIQNSACFFRSIQKKQNILLHVPFTIVIAHLDYNPCF